MNDGIELSRKVIHHIMGWYEIGSEAEDFDGHGGYEAKLYKKLDKFYWPGKKKKTKGGGL